MDYLLYAKTFWSERGNGRASTHDWYTDRRWLWKRVSRGDRLWVVIAGPKETPGEWRLLEKLEVAKSDPSVRRSGRRYRIVGSRKRSQGFDFGESQEDVAPVLKRLEFSSGRRVEYAGTEIGRSIRTPRRLTLEDVAKLEEFAAKLAKR